MTKPQLNKKNLTKFANHIYEEKGDKIHYLPLCYGNLFIEKGNVIGCALGEMYDHFIAPIHLIHKYDATTPYVIDRLSHIAKLKIEYLNNSAVPKYAWDAAGHNEHFVFSGKLHCMMAANDSYPGETEAAYIGRAKRVQNIMLEAAELLV